MFLGDCKVYDTQMCMNNAPGAKHWCMQNTLIRMYQSENGINAVNKVRLTLYTSPICLEPYLKEKTKSVLLIRVTHLISVLADIVYMS